MKRLVKIIMSILSIVLMLLLMPLNVHAETLKEYFYSSSHIGNTTFDDVNQYYWVSANTDATYPSELVFAVTGPPGYYFEAPYESGEKINVVISYCNSGTATSFFSNVFSHYENSLDYVYKTGATCSFPSWYGTEYLVFYTLKLGTANYDEIDTVHGTEYEWYYRLEPSFYYINRESYDISTRVLSIRKYSNSEYNSLIAEYKQLANQTETSQKLFDKLTDMITITQEEIDQAKKQVEELEKLNESVKDSEIDSSDANDFFDGFETEDNGGISDIVTMPLDIVAKATDSCSPVKLTWKEKDIELPCGDTLFWNRSDVSSFRVIWQFLFGGPIIYGALVLLFKTIQNLKNPDSSKVEVMKL